jgi:hypothetical protein
MSTRWTPPRSLSGSTPEKRPLLAHDRSRRGATVTNETFGIGIAPRAGIDITVSSSLSLYPRASLSLGYGGYDEKSAGNENKTTDPYVSVGLYAPLLAHLAPHWFVGFGPTIAHDLTHPYSYPLVTYQNRQTTFGAALSVGGWL